MKLRALHEEERERAEPKEGHSDHRCGPDEVDISEPHPVAFGNPLDVDETANEKQPQHRCVGGRRGHSETPAAHDEGVGSPPQAPTE